MMLEHYREQMINSLLACALINVHDVRSFAVESRGKFLILRETRAKSAGIGQRRHVGRRLLEGKVRVDIAYIASKP